MSGGTFDYQNYNLHHIADTIQNLLDKNHETWYNYKPETLSKIRKLRDVCKQLDDDLHHLDYLYAGDIGEDTFNERVNCEAYV